MITMANKEKFLISNTNFLNNYDKHNFISISNSALNKGNLLSLVDVSHFDDNFDYLNNSLEEIQIPFPNDMIEYFDSIANLDRISNWTYKMISVLNLNKDITIKPQYLLEASENIRDSVNKIISNGADAEGAYTNYYADSDLHASVLKQRVIGGINDYETPESLFSKKYVNIEDDSISVTVNDNCIRNEIIPFIKNFNNIKSDIRNEINNASHIIHDTFILLNETMSIVNRNSDNLKPETFSLVANYLYNHVRNVIDTASTVLFLYISKCYLLEKIVLTIKDVYTTIKNEFSDCEDLVESGIFDNREISLTESTKISKELLNGNNSIFSETVDNIMNYHRGFILSCVYGDNFTPDIDSDDFISTISNRYRNYDNTTFESVEDIYDNIERGLDIIKENMDDPFLIVNKIKTESGFNTSLHDQYNYIIEMVDDVNDYYDFSSSSIYFNLLGEISSFNESTKTIAESANEIFDKISNIKESIDYTLTGESKNELKELVESVENQFISINQDIATKSYNRLKQLAQKADYSLNAYVESGDEPEFIIGDNNDDWYKNYFIESCLKDLHEDNDILMESMLKGYYSEREYLEKGIRIVFEDGESGNGNSNGGSNSGTQSSGTQQSSSSTQSTQTTNTNNNTTPSVNTSTSATVVTDQNENNSQKMEKLSDKIKKIIDKIIQAFRDFINKFKKKNLEWLNKNKAALINRSYSNVTINVLPYHTEMPETTIFNHYTTLEKNVEKVAKDINKFDDKTEMRNKLFTFGVKFNDNVDEAKTLTTYFKVGNKDLNNVKYSNGEVKTLVSDVMIPYCERYYTSLADEVANYAEKLSSVTAKYQQNTSQAQQQTGSNTTQQPTTNTGDNNQQNNNTNQNDASTNTPGDRYIWLSGYISDFVGSVCNATRARNDDYIKILAQLVPKKSVFKNQNNNQNNANSEQQQTNNNEQNNN